MFINLFHYKLYISFDLKKESLTEEELRGLLLKNVHKVETAMTDFLHDKNVLDGYLSIVKNNPDIQQPAYFHAWLKQTFYFSACTYIRQETDKSPDVFSLAKVLMLLKDNPTIISKKWHKELYAGTDLDTQADHNFEKYAGKGNYFDSKIAEKDLKNLEFISKNIRLYVNKRIAHRTEDRVKEIFYVEIDKCVEEYEKVAIKYILLLTGKQYGQLKPISDFSFFNVFKKPFIVNPFN